MAQSEESFMFTVGKLDAGMAILLGERAHLIEFPSLLLPPGATTGSIVNISVAQNINEEKKRDTEFWNLQNDILEMYGSKSPEPPKLEVRNVTQTSVTLEWPPLLLQTAKLRSLDIYRNRQRLAAIPSPLTNTSTKLSGLSLNTEYTFQLVLRTSAGTFPSNLLRVRTHTMADTSGVSVCFGNVQDPALLADARAALDAMGARWSDKIQIDTTHFVCTTPAAAPGAAAAAAPTALSSAPSIEYQKALQLSIPVVHPHWVLACHSEKRMMPIQGFYLGKDAPRPAAHTRPQSMSQAASSRDSVASPRAANRQSMPPVRSPAGSPTLPARPTPQSPRFVAPQESDTEGEVTEEEEQRPTHVRKGTMSKDFRFPSPAPTVVPAVPAVPPVGRNPLPHAEADPPKNDAPAPLPLEKDRAVTPSSVEVPPPPPVDKEPTAVAAVDEEVGETEEISLN